MELIIISDDLTGAAIAGAQVPDLCRRQLHLTSLERLTREWADCEGLAVTTETRAAAPPEAVRAMERAAELIRPLSPNLIYKKIDSCLRGQVGLELAALVTHLGREGALVAPTCPAFSLVRASNLPCEGGRHCPKGYRVSEEGRGPLLIPVYEGEEGPRAAVLARGHDLPTATLSLPLVRRGAGAAAAEVARILEARSAPTLIVAEAETDSDLGILARAGLYFKQRLVLSGAAAYASALNQMVPDGVSLEAPEVYPARPIFFFGERSIHGGSAQIDFLVRSGLARSAALDTDDLLSGPGWPAQPPGPLDQDLALILPRDETGRAETTALVRAFALFAARLIAEAGPGTVFLSGAEVAPAMLRALKPRRLRLLAEMLPGIVHLDTGDYSILLQTGGFADETLLAHIYGCL